MKVTLTGANSAVGRAILACEPKGGAEAIAFLAAVRSERAVEQIRSVRGGSDGVVCISYDDPRSLDTAVHGAAAVIHLAGLLVERPDSTYEQANVSSTQNVVDAAKRGGVQKIILVSALGADESSRNRYYRTKGQAESLVRASGLSYTVLRVPLLLGPGTAGAAALQRNVNTGRVRLIRGGNNLQQPLAVGDLARAAVVAAARPSVASNATLELVGPVSLREREIVKRAERLSGRHIRVTSIPKGLVSLMLVIRRRVSGPGFSRDALDVITADTKVDPQPATRELGISLTGIDEMIQDSLGEG